MDGLLSKAEFMIERSQKLIRDGIPPHNFNNDLHSKFNEIYHQETSKDLAVKHISLAHKILEKLVKRDKLNCLIVNLYKGNDGYALAVKNFSGVENETIRLKYEDDCFLQYLDNEELPPMLLDLLDESKIDIYYSGCIIAEMRDFRKFSDSVSYESQYILLRPTNQSIVADVASLSMGKNWSMDEKLFLESEIVKRTNPSLNLSPSILVGLVNNKIHQQRHKLSSFHLKRSFRRFTQVNQNRVKDFMESKPSPSFPLFNFFQTNNCQRMVLKSNKQSVTTSSINNSNNVPPPKDTVAKDCFDLIKQQEEMQSFYKQITEDVRRLSKSAEVPIDTSDNSLVFIEEYTLETERAQGRIYLTKLTISQRKSDDIYFGELYVDRDYQEGKQNGSSCQFQLGNQDQVHRYIQQFREILTEEGRKSVKITHRLAGCPPAVVMTTGCKEKKEMERATQQHESQNGEVISLENIDIKMA